MSTEKTESKDCPRDPVATRDAERASADYEVGEWIEQHRLAISRDARRSLVELIVFARAAAALPIDFKQATDQGGWQPAAYLLTRPSGFSWVLMPFDITPYTRAIFEAEGTTIEPLYAAQIKAPTEDGRQLVPKEPTETMLDDGWDALDAADNEGDFVSPEGIKRLWRAMLAAAPTLLGVADGDAVGGKSGVVK